MQTNVFGVLLDAKDLFSYQLFTFFEISPESVFLALDLVSIIVLETLAFYLSIT